MGRVILDTNLIIDHKLNIPGADVAISSVSLAELRYGVACAPSETVAVSRQAMLDEVLALFGGGIPFDDHAAQSYGLMTRLIKAAGGNPRAHTVDLMIAATAHAHHAVVATRNTVDFSRLAPLVKVIAP